MSTPNTAQSFGQLDQMVECLFTNYVVVSASPVVVAWTSDIAPVLSKEFLDIQATIECGFTLKCVRDMITRYSQMHRSNKYSKHNSIIWPVWPNGWVVVYKLSGFGLESRCNQLNLRCRTCLDEWVRLHSTKYRVQIHSEMRTWHDNKIQSNALYK